MLEDRKTLLDTLDLNSADKAQLIQSMNTRASLPESMANRRRMRLPFDQAPPVVIKPIDDRGTDMRYSVQPRNLSRWGISVIHGRFIYTDTLCLVAVPALDCNYTVHSAVVRNCRHVRGMVHEVSLVFSDPIELEEYIDLTDEQLEAARHEAEEEAKAIKRQQSKP